MVQTEAALSGLTEAEAQDALERAGPNELPRARSRGLVAIAAETMREPMFLLLIGAAALYLVLGDLGEGLFLLVGASAAIGLVIFQEARSERALAALRDLAQPQARVLREGRVRLIASRDLAPGDVIVLGEGDRVPADAILIAGDVLEIDQSALTGESATVSKHPAPAAHWNAAIAPSPQEDSAWLFAGVLVTRGQGEGRVTRTGAHSALGEIGRSLAEIDQGPTPLQKSAGRVVALLGVCALLFCALVSIAYGLLRGEWINAVLAGVTVAIALIPEEFPMVLAVFLALGAWRLAAHRVLVRRSAVIETLGAATALCVDKTGTLTQNHMRVARLWTKGKTYELISGAGLDADARDLLSYARLASNVRPVDPMDRAVGDAAPALSWALASLEPERSWPLRSELMAVVMLWRLSNGEALAAAKGAPEAIFKLCRISADAAADLNRVIADFAADGFRVLGVAHVCTHDTFPDRPEEFSFEFDGLIGFLDPLRDDVPLALSEAKAAGIKVLMITGDHPATALAIARSAGIETSAGVLTGVDLARLSPPDLRKAVEERQIYARVAPDQKLKIVEALKANGEVVAMTGDGVNDAPALEAAHIGVAMGRRGADVAREAADLILLDDGFASIVGGVRLGRRIFTNLRKALTYVVAIHAPIAGLALLPILMGMPQLLFPMHVVLLELAIDPTCALAFEAERSAPGAMKKPPRRADEPLFGRRQLSIALLEGGGVLIATLALYAWALGAGDEARARGAAFAGLVIANLTLALVNAIGPEGRILDPERRGFWMISAAVAAALAAALYAPVLTAIFHMAPPNVAMWPIVLIVGVLSGSLWWLAARARALFERR